MQKPLADLIRPEKLEDMVGQSHLLDKNSTFRRVIDSGHISNMIFYGPPGTGKTTMANIIAKKTNMSLYKLNGTTASTEDIKKIIADVNGLFNTNGILLYLDEIQYLNKKQQQSLLEFVESGDITLIASTTENPFLISPLQDNANKDNASFSKETSRRFAPLDKPFSISFLSMALNSKTVQRDNKAG